MVGRADKSFSSPPEHSHLQQSKKLLGTEYPHHLSLWGQLADKLKELGLGIECEMIEKVTVHVDWYEKI